MPTFDVVTAEQWEAARSDLRAQEAEAAKAHEAVNAARRKLPAVLVDKDYQFDGPAGRASLLDLFEGRKQLIVYHFMFQPGWDEGCPMCSHMMDNVGHLAHFNALGTTFAAVSMASQAKIRPFRARMGWQMPWYTSVSYDFYADFHATEERGALTVFLRDGDAVYHTYSAYDGEVDLTMLEESYLDLTQLGLPSAGLWPKHHDRYGS
jgi:predicted dithiol-disulfide oxidoreductase (DUF899 family)